MYIETMSSLPIPDISYTKSGLYKQFSNPVTGREVEAAEPAAARFLQNLSDYLKEKIVETLALRGIVDQGEIDSFISENFNSSKLQELNISISSEEVTAKRNSIKKIITDSFSDEDENENKDEDIITLFLGSFIGRANPPHPGHIMTMLEVILEALRRGGSALILLGSGPGKKTNEKNPIPFILKRLFIILKLIEELEELKRNREACLQGVDIPSLFMPAPDISRESATSTPSTYDRIRIEEMGNQVEQHRQFLKKLSDQIEAQTNLILQSVLFVGAKDEDAKKLDFVPKTLIKSGIDATTQALPPKKASTGEAMSATYVRQVAVENDEDYFTRFLDGHFNISPPISVLIHFLPVEEHEAFLKNYGKYIKNETFDFAKAFWTIINEETDKAKAAELKAELEAQAKAEKELKKQQEPQVNREKTKAKIPVANEGKKARKINGGFKSRKRKQTKRKQTRNKKTKKRRTKRQTKKR